MNSFDMLHEIALLAERLLADVTGVGALPGMNPHVARQMAALAKALAADLTLVGADAGVGAEMAAQAAALAEQLEAEVALVPLFAAQRPSPARQPVSRNGTCETTAFRICKIFVLMQIRICKVLKRIPVPVPVWFWIKSPPKKVP
jgi:hypothetical protein